MPCVPAAGFPAPYAGISVLTSPGDAVPKRPEILTEMKLHHFGNRRNQTPASPRIGQTLAYTMSMYTLIYTAFFKVKMKLIPNPIPKTQQNALLA